jgi:hypothetical protein
MHGTGEAELARDAGTLPNRRHLPEADCNCSVIPAEAGIQAGGGWPVKGEPGLVVVADLRRAFGVRQAIQYLSCSPRFGRHDVDSRRQKGAVGIHLCTEIAAFHEALNLVSLEQSCPHLSHRSVRGIGYVHQGVASPASLGRNGRGRRLCHQRNAAVRTGLHPVLEFVMALWAVRHLSPPIARICWDIIAFVVSGGCTHYQRSPRLDRHDGPAEAYGRIILSTP